MLDSSACSPCCSSATSPPENLARWIRENGANVTTEVRAGAFRFDDLLPGAYLLMFASPLGRTQMQVSVQGNQTVTVALKKENMQPLQNPPGGAGGNNPPPNGGRR